MEKLKKFITRGLIGGACLFTLMACGNTGPDAKSSGISSGSGASSSSIDGLGSQSSAQSSEPVSAFTASMPDIEIVEGTFPIVDGRLDSDGRPYTRLGIDIQFSKPLEEDAKFNLIRDMDRTQCPRDFDETVIAPDEPITVTAGSRLVSFVVEAFPDEWMENDCDSYFKLKKVGATDDQSISVTGKVRLVDDDHQPSWGAEFSYGDNIWIPLMGSRDHDGRTFKVQQISGRTIRHAVEGKYLHFTLPGTPENTLAPEIGNVSVEGFYFNITPSNGDPEFQVRVHVPLQMSDDYIVDDGMDEDPDPEDKESYNNFIWKKKAIESVKLNGFEHNYFYKDISKISWTLKTESPQNVVKIYPLSFSGFKSVSEEDFAIFLKEGALLLDDDNRTIRFNPKVIPLLSKYIHNDRPTDMKVEINICENDGADARCGYRWPLLRLRPANIQLSVLLTNLSQQVLLESERFAVVVKEITATTEDISRATRVIPMSSLSGALGNFNPGQYELTLRDYKGEYRAEQTITLYPTDMEKNISLDVVRDSYSPQDLRQNNTTKSGKGKLQKASVSADCEELENYYELVSGDKDKELACTKEFTTDDLRGEEKDKSRQFIVQVESLEYPSFTPKAGLSFNDTWSYELTASGDPVNISQKASGVVNATHTTQRTITYASPCFTLGEKDKNTAKFSAKVQNVGDNQINTKVRVKVADCLDTFSIGLAKLENRKVDDKGLTLPSKTDGGGKVIPHARINKFINPRDKLDRSRAYISVPIDKISGVTSDADELYNFSFSLYVKNLTDSVKPENIKVDKIKLYLEYQEGADSAHIDRQILLKEFTVSTTPALNVLDWKEHEMDSKGKYLMDGKVYKKKLIGKEVKVVDYRLPFLGDFLSSDDEFLKNIKNAKTVRLYVEAFVSDGNNQFKTDSYLRIIDSDIGISGDGIVNFYPIMDVLSLDSRHKPLSTSKRVDWDAVTSSVYRYSGRDLEYGYDAWTTNAVWDGFFLRKLTDINCSTSAEDGACTTGLMDPKTSLTDLVNAADYLDEFKVNDISPPNVACYAQVITKDNSETLDNNEETYQDNRCRSVTGHWSHHNAMGFDVRYLNGDGQTGSNTVHGGQGTPKNSILSEWHKANNSSKTVSEIDQSNARKLIRKWIITNRKYFSWIARELKDASDSQIKVETVFVGSDTYTQNTKASKSLHYLLKEGVIPQKCDVNPAPIPPATCVNPDDEKSLDAFTANGFDLTEHSAHSDHFHIDFKYK